MSRVKKYDKLMEEYSKIYNMLKLYCVKKNLRIYDCLIDAMKLWLDNKK